MKVEIDKIKQILIYAMLFFASMNFAAKFFYFAFASLIIIMLFQRKLMANATTLVYLALGGLMALYNSPEGVLSMIRCFAYVALYIVGINMTTVRADKRALMFDYEHNEVEKIGYTVIAVVSAGSFTHYFLNFITNISGITGRNTTDIWSGETMAATGQSTLACLMLGFSVSIILLSTSKWVRFIGIASVFIMLWYNLVLAGRTMIVILLVLFVVGILYTRKALDNSLERLKLLIGISSVVLFVSLIFAFNIGGLRDMMFSSNLFGRFESSFASLTEDALRATGKLSFLGDFFKYPFGGLNMRDKYGYAHDLLLDGYDEYGLFGLILLVAILVLGIVEVYKLLSRTTYHHAFKLGVLLIYIAMLLQFLVEPILAGMPWLFTCFSLINGVVAGMNMSYSRNESELS